MMDPALRTLIARAVNAPESEIDDDSTWQTIGTWDSFAEVAIAANLDRQYGIELSAADAERLTSVREIRAVLAERGVIV
ncbi:MAG TPA: acyl carrier protein [Candidatus Baltobacteraceae bacterium]|nr:acyl carrier protein [Candidatus Baltobacteraceae bacterium]